MTLRVLTEHHSEFLSLNGGCTVSPDSTHVKTPHCSKSHYDDDKFFLECNTTYLHVIENIFS